MFRLCLEMEEENITEYIENHHEKLKYKEGFFVEYIKSPHYTALEKKMILIKQNGLFYQSMDIFQQAMRCINQNSSVDYNFSNYLEQEVKGCDILIRNISYIVLPLMQMVGIERFDDRIFYKLCLEIRNQMEPEILNDVLQKMEEIHSRNVLDNYLVAGLIKKDSKINNLYEICMTEEYARGMLLYYNKLYSKETVRDIRKLVKERVH